MNGPVADLACRDFVELVTEYLEDALHPELRAAFEAHLEVCTGCRIYLGQMRLVVRALREPAPSVPAPRRETFRRLFPPVARGPVTAPHP